MAKKTKRIATLYSTRYSRNDGSPLYYTHNLKKLPDTEVIHLDPEQDMRGYGKFDFTFHVDWGEDALLGREKALALPLPPDPGKTIYVASDTHLDDGYRFEKATQFDYVFFNQKHAVEEYMKYLGYTESERPNSFNSAGLSGYGYMLYKSKKSIGQKVTYLPHAAEPQAYPRYEILKKYDLCFIGHMQEYHKGNGINMSRLDVLHEMFQAIPNFYFGSRHPAYPNKHLFEDVAKKFCQSKIVFNISVGNDVNMRLFEAMVTGSFLLTNKIPELENLKAYGFESGKHFVTYDSIDKAVHLANYYISHDSDREVIAKRAYEQALKTGTYKSRIDEIFEIVK
jgi:hypothetical protein